MPVLAAPPLGADVGVAPDAFDANDGLVLSDVDDPEAAFAVYGRRFSKSPFPMLGEFAESVDVRLIGLSLAPSVKDVPVRRGGGGGGIFLLSAADDDVPPALGSLGADVPFHSVEAAGKLL